MWNWLKRTVTGSEPPALLSPEQLTWLQGDLGRLDALKAGISRRLIAFLLRGEQEEVLGEVAAVAGASGAVEMKVKSGWQKPQNLTDRRLFIESLETGDVPFLLRLAAVYDAISQSEPRDLNLAGLPPEAAWLEVFVLELTQKNRHTAHRPVPRVKVASETLEAMLAANGQAPDLLVRAALFVDVTRYAPSIWADMLLGIPSLAESFVRHPETVREAFGQKDYRARVHVLEYLGKVKAPLAQILGDIVQAGVASAKQVREAAIALLFGEVPGCLPRLQEIAAQGDNDERLRAAQLLWKLSPEGSRAFLEERAGAEKSKRIAGATQEMLAPAGVAAGETESTALDLPPPLPKLNPLDPLPPGFSEHMESAFAKAAVATDAGWERVKNNPWAKQPVPFQAPAVARIVDFLEGRAKFDQSKLNFVLPQWAGMEGQKVLNEATAFPGCTLLHAFRWAIVRRGQFAGHGYWLNQAHPILAPALKARKAALDLRELAVVMEAAGIHPHGVGVAYLRQNRHVSIPLFKLPPEKIWPYFAEHLEILDETFGLRPKERPADSQQRWASDYWDAQRRMRAFGVLADFPAMPGQFLGVLWDLALGPGKSERRPAQEALARVPGKEAKIIAALGNGQQELRANAANWIADLKMTSAIGALETALEKEKSEVVKGALFDALESLGVSLDPYLDRKKLAGQAAKGLAKGISKELEWFPFAQLPAVHWEDSGAAVPPSVLTWFLVQGSKLKDPTPTPLLRRYAALFKPAERVALGKFVLQVWITQDTLPACTSEEAAAKADASTKQMAVYVQQQLNSPAMAQYYADWSEEKHRRSYFQFYLAQCKGSAIDSKGILAVAGACAEGDVAPLVQRYLKRWYGNRHAQGKALVQMLSSIEHPAAIQLLLSVGNRFRTKGIQEEAARACSMLAERKGWTLDELADRTIPTAGFDENGVLELSYGTRTFTARLGEDFEITLQNQDGREISSLPEPNQADDPAVAKETKQRLSAARKELKGILKAQLERLYEAMCTQRTWSFADWDTYLNRHTIVGSYAQRLVWGVVENGAFTHLFRPLPDGSLTDEHDDAATLAPEQTVGLAHDALLTPEQRTAWTTHLSDYDITPLFAQFGRPKFELTPERREATEIKDFEGHLLEAFKLRGRLTKLGYSRGAAQDGGWWNTYHKRFLGLGIEAAIEFTGSPMPEENRTVALISLGFQRLGEEGRAEGENIPLGELPVVLLTECWNDIRAAAAEGKGFDPDWQKKAAY